MDAIDLGPESLLGPDGEGQTAADLRDKLALALRYIANWYKATAASDNKQVWWGKIDAERFKVEAAFKAMDPALVFPGKKELAIYADAAAGFPALYRDLALSADTLPYPGILEELASIPDTILQIPGYVVYTATNALAKGVGGGLASIWANTWPWLLAAGGALLIYTFRVPLGIVAAKAAAR